MIFKRSVTLAQVDPTTGTVNTHFSPAKSLLAVPPKEQPAGYMWDYPEGADPSTIKLLISSDYEAPYKHRIFAGPFIRPATREPVIPGADLTPAQPGQSRLVDEEVLYDVVYDQSTGEVRVIYYVLFKCSDVVHLYAGQNYGKEGYRGHERSLPPRLRYVLLNVK